MAIKKTERLSDRGKVIDILPEKEFMSKTGIIVFKDYVIDIKGQYPHKLCFSLCGIENIQQNNLQIGDDITVFYRINSKKIGDRWYTSVTAWKINKHSTLLPDGKRVKKEKKTIDLDSLPF